MKIFSLKASQPGDFKLPVSIWRLLCLNSGALLLSWLSVNIYAESYTLDAAIIKAQAIDPWVNGSISRQESLQALSEEAGSLPDPTISLGFANLPTDTFDFSQEAMTQFKVGVRQLFPRGKTLALKRERFEKLSQVQQKAREDRKARVAVIVSHLWLEAYRNELTIHLIEKDRDLFEHLVDVSQSNYTSTVGRSRQQDIVRAQLELTRLDDRLTRLRMLRDTHIAQLGEWLNDASISLYLPQTLKVNAQRTTEPLLTAHISSSWTSPDAIDDSKNNNIKVARLLGEHPLIQSIDQKLHAFETDIDLARQSYKPQWGINASYGYRDESPTGADRSDFFSAGLTFDIPLFGRNRQDKKVQSAHAEFEAVKTERALALRKLKSGYESAKARHYRLIERQSLFNTRLLREMIEQAEASLSAYTNDNGDFAEVVRAQIAELNARIEAIDVVIDLQKNLAQLNYFKAGRLPQKPESMQGDK